MTGQSSSPEPPHRCNRAVVRRFVGEVINRGEVERLAEFVAADHLTHCPDGELYGREGVRLDVNELWAAFPDLQIELSDIEAEDDRVAYRFHLRGTHRGEFLGIPPSGRRVSLPGSAVHRLIDGRIAESWTSYDVMALM